MYKKAVVYYFTGTGNSLYLAKKAQETLAQRSVMAELRDIASSPRLDSEADLIILCYPVYAFGLPRIVDRFVRQLPSLNGRDAVVIANMADSAGPAAHAGAALLLRKQARILAATEILMPNNYIIMDDSDSDERIASTLKAARTKVTEVLGQCLEGSALDARYVPRRPSLLYRVFYRGFALGISMSARFMRTTPKCIGCAQCARLCPVGTITMKANKPVWGKGCEHCLRCLNLCPAAAIEFGRFTRNRRRYTYLKELFK